MRRLAAALLTATAALSACGGGADGPAESPSPTRADAGAEAPPGGGSAPLPATRIQPLVAALPELSLAPLPAMRLADGLTPPTNRWFSGLVFGAEPQPVFPLPLAFSMDDTSYGAGLPQVVTSEDAIVGSHQQDVSFEVVDAETTVVSGYDDASVTLETRDADGGALGRTTIAQGSPYVTHVAVTDETLTSSVPFSGTRDVVTAETATGSWGLRVDGTEVDGDTLVLSPGDTVVLFPVPADGDLDTMAEHAVPLVGTTTSYDVGSDDATTTITYETDGGTGAFAVMPHQSGAIDGSCELGSFPSVYGSLALCPGSTLSWSAPRASAQSALDLSDLSDEDREELAEQVARDVEDLPDAPADTYFGGKWLYRTGQLMTIAEQVGADETAADARSQLVEMLRTWTETDGCLERSERCFGYDPEWRGIVGQTAAFGSELFNDHHFHYGYFLYAAAVAVEADPSLADELSPVVTLLAADIAGGADTGLTPRWRPFDVYASHSWAAGTGDFADGNNQESSSEAVTAWAGLVLWARAVEDDDLQRQAEWMMSSEAHAATSYWTDFDVDDPVYDGFDHGAVGINWGGKRDYATWFSPEPSAILGIQLIPMSPSSGYLAGDPARVTANASEAGDGPLGDYALMYAGMAGPPEAAAALDRARDLPDDSIDQGSSRSYMLAFLMVLATDG